MFPRELRAYLLAAIVLVSVLAHLGTGSARAAGFEGLASSCWASGSLSEDAIAIAGAEERWSCTDRAFTIEPERLLLRFELAPGEALPEYFLARRSALAAVHLLALDQDGSVRQASVPAAALKSAIIGGFFQARLPEVTQKTEHVVVAIDLPSHRMTLEQAYLAPPDALAGSAPGPLLLVLAGLAGMLIMPLIFNLAFYRILREPFVLWHSALTVSLLATILISSGLSVVLFDAPAMMLNWMTALVFGVTIASGLMFTFSFIEPNMMHPVLRRLLPYGAAWAVMLGLFHAAFPFVARPIQSSVYTAAFAPVLVVFVLATLDALRRGSRAARFQVIGYAPMILVGTIRLVTGVVPWLESTDAMLMFYIGCVWEVLFTTLGLADRFVIIKHERDHARTEANVLGKLTETDPLTGLLNRRAIEEHFSRLGMEGFATLAVIDLDHFKTINDVHGHAAGDAVLKAVANALQVGPDVCAYRLGGEEFMLFLRGEDALREAERRRQAIPAIVANQVPGLGRPVTASMGLTQCHGGEGLAKVYVRADTLLYQAKSAGRNRTHSDIAPTTRPAAGAA